MEKQQPQWISSKHDLLMDSLTKFFRISDNIRKILPIVQGKSAVSLRLLDWFVTNYCKKRNIVLDLITEKGDPKRFMIYLDYKSQLKAYSKKQFDPFCRRERIRFIYQKGQELITTVGQLNFFRWMITNSIFQYIEEHLEEIEEDMNASICSHQKRWGTYSVYENSWCETPETLSDESMDCDKETFSYENLQTNVFVGEDGKKKRHELSISATKTVNKHNVKILVEFN